MISHTSLIATLLLFQGGAGSKDKPFLDQTKSVPSQLEWDREVVSTKGGSIRFVVDSQGPVAVTVIADRSYKAMMSGAKSGFHKSDVILTKDYKGPSCEGVVELPQGSSWFIIENHAAKTAKIRLRCWPAPKSDREAPRS